MKILLVDDSKVMRNIWTKVVAQLGGVSTVEAEDGCKALDAVMGASTPFDLILLDWNMPNMDGITFLKKLREKDAATRVIMVTTEAEKRRVVEAVRAGVNNYVVKPFTPEMLLGKIREVIPAAAS